MPVKIRTSLTLSRVKRKLHTPDTFDLAFPGVSMPPSGHDLATR